MFLTFFIEKTIVFCRQFFPQKKNINFHQRGFYPKNVKFCQSCFIVLFLRGEVFRILRKPGGYKIARWIRENAINIGYIERAREETSPDDDAEYPVFSDADPRFSEALIRLDARKRRKWRNVGPGAWKEGSQFNFRDVSSPKPNPAGKRHFRVN